MSQLDVLSIEAYKLIHKPHLEVFSRGASLFQASQAHSIGGSRVSLNLKRYSNWVPEGKLKRVSHKDLIGALQKRRKPSLLLGRLAKSSVCTKGPDPHILPRQPHQLPNQISHKSAISTTLTLLGLPAKLLRPWHPQRPELPHGLKPKCSSKPGG